MLDLTPDELLTTTRAVRRRLDLTRPVERSLVEECLDVALQAPNGGNRQRWRWIFVDDADTKARIADVYRTALVEYSRRPRSTPAPPAGDRRSEPMSQRNTESVMFLYGQLHQVPVLLVPVQRGRTEGLDVFAGATYWASIIPPIWSFMLALRARGLGSAWTTLTLQRENDIAQILGIPDGHTHAGLFPVAYTVGTDFRRAERQPAAEVMAWNGWE